jgi:uncharacterized damage-inducible protein DinB
VTDLDGGDEMTLKDELHQTMAATREALVWKLDGLSEYDIRRPLTRTGTNLLGLVKHLTVVEMLYFGYSFDRPVADPPSWFRQDGLPNEEMWATPDESRAYILDTYARAGRHADATIAALSLDTVGRVEWWQHVEGGKATLRQIMVHVVAEGQRHLGHADIVRELIDGAAGLLPYVSMLPEGDDAWWASHRAAVQRAAEEVRG